MKQTEIIKEYLQKEEDIAAVYLYGSAAVGRDQAKSDIDIALLYKQGMEPDVNKRLQITDHLTSALKKEVDLLILNRASPIIRMQVLKKGMKLLERDRKEVNRFFVQTINEYSDLKITRSVIEKNISRARIYG
jgi:predicted nucleotidyltransferase